jgi:hypothetical protein
MPNQKRNTLSGMYRFCEFGIENNKVALAGNVEQNELQ